MLELLVSFGLLAYAIVATFATVEAGKHPRALYFLFGAEMWERFSYYGMRALLVLYLIDYHGWQPQDSSSVYKWYTSLVYLTPLIGGFLADQFLGLRASIVIGGTLMALGHFLMAFEPIPIFYVALACLVAGNGFFKPNMSTLVGKMYRKDDPRRDAAFTIFYMGINVGAGIAPIWCAAVRERMHSFHWGFALAGIGMLAGLVNFLIGHKTVNKAVVAAGNDLRTMRDIRRDEAREKKVEAAKEAGYREPAVKNEAERSDDDKPGTTGISAMLSAAYPYVLLVGALALPAYYGWLVYTHVEKPTGLVMPTAFGLVFLAMGILLRTLRGAAKDKSIVIFVLFVFVVIFWMAFEQAGNALNLWAEYFTDRHIRSSSYTAESFQSANPIFILLFAPLFSAAWVFLARRGWEPRTPTKIFIAMLFMAASFAIMVVGAVRENAVITTVAKPFAVPKALTTGGDGEVMIDGKPLDAGRLVVTRAAVGPMHADAFAAGIGVRGVLAPYVVQEMFEKTAPPGWGDFVKSLDDATKNATPQTPFDAVVTAETFKMPLDEAASKESGLTYDGAARTLHFTKHAAADVRTALAAAAPPPDFREAVNAVAEQSKTARNTGIWLLLSYLFATLGELCLSPVGLSMVTKLAPRRFASLFMGVWLLTSSVAQYAGGSIGESWGRVTPTDYFWLFVWTSLAGAALLAVLVWPLKRLMHEVH